MKEKASKMYVAKYSTEKDKYLILKKWFYLGLEINGIECVLQEIMSLEQDEFLRVAKLVLGGGQLNSAEYLVN